LVGRSALAALVLSFLFLFSPHVFEIALRNLVPVHCAEARVHSISHPSGFRQALIALKESFDLLTQDEGCILYARECIIRLSVIVCFLRYFVTIA
jgi:hypothetical protein